MKVTDTWRTLHDLISEIYKLQPWSYLEETDIFGIHSPLSDKKYFVSIMGSTGTLHAVSAYDGAKALSQFWALEESGNPDGGDILTIPHFILTFTTEEYVDENQLKILRSIKKDFGYTDELPEVKCILPCQFPKDPDETQLEDFIIILGQTLQVCLRAKTDPSLILSDDKDMDEYLVREYTRTKAGNAWTDKYRKIKLPSLTPKVKWNRNDIDELISLPASKAILQLHFQLLPLWVKGEGDVVYFPVTVILTHKKSGYIENNHLLTPEPDYETTLEKIPKIVLDFIKALGFRPRCIEVKNPVLFEMLYEPMRLASVKLVLKESLLSVEDAINHFIESVKEKK
jgi:hypothetical protein